ncbi:MAG: hypothetical protein K9N23_04080, partial [Akkermansiaceae bacterium]|nr:hypothetical protein [Akkermansiaceae bacterium]
MNSILHSTTTLSLALLTGLALLAPTVAHAQINYQGTLTDALGAPLADGQEDINFSLWTAATGGI